MARRIVFLFICIWAVGFSLPGLAEVVRQTENIADVFSEANTGDLVFLDLDRVTLDHTHTLGSEAWYSFRWTELRSKGLSEEEVKRITYYEMGKYSLISRVVPVDDRLPLLVQAAQSRGVTVMALTARHHIMLEGTRRQLRYLGIDLEGRAPIHSPQNLFDSASYSHGIIFADVHTKGEAMTAFLSLAQRSANFVPHKILFVDDKAPHAENVLTAGMSLGIPTVSYHYRKADPIIKSVDPQMVHLQTLLHPPHFPVAEPDALPLLNPEAYYLDLLTCQSVLLNNL